MLRTHVALTLVLLVGLAACARKEEKADAGPVAANDNASILMAGDVFNKAYNAKDPDGVASVYTEDAQLLPPGGAVVRGRDAIRAHYAAEIKDHWVLLTIRTVDSATSGDWGWRSGTWTAELTPPVTGKYVEVWRRTPQGWRIYRDIWNDDAPPAPPPAPAPAQ